MSIQVALHHKTEYHYDRAITVLPQVIRLRPAPHCRTPIVSCCLRWVCQAPQASGTRRNVDGLCVHACRLPGPFSQDAGAPAQSVRLRIPDSSALHWPTAVAKWPIPRRIENRDHLGPLQRASAANTGSYVADLAHV